VLRKIVTLKQANGDILLQARGTKNDIFVKVGSRNRKGKALSLRSPQDVILGINGSKNLVG
jgi:hypothetical protein